MRKLSVAIVSIGCVLSSFVARAQAPTATHAKVLHLRAPHIVIDQPGMYVLDRNWLIPGPGVFTADGAKIIEITANDVVLDLRGFTIDTPDAEGSSISIGGANVTLRNGKITSGHQVLDVDGASTVIDTVEMQGDGLVVNGPDTVVRNSSLKDGDLFMRGDHYLIEGNRFDCVTTCVNVTGDRGVFRNNQLYRGGSQFGSGGVLGVSGSANTIENNYLESVELNPSAIFVRTGRQNVIAHNTMVMTQGFGGGAAIRVEGGSENVIDGNIANHSTPNVRWELGVVFVLGASGNFFGNNRMKSDQPFAQHSGPQVDWGGNVGY